MPPTISQKTAKLPKRGRMFSKNVYRDGYVPWIGLNTEVAALTAGKFFSPTQVQTMISTPAVNECVIGCGPSDALQMFAIGRNSAADIINSLASLLVPHYAGDEDDAEPVGYMEVFLASHVWTLGATQIGTAANGRPVGNGYGTGVVAFADTDLFAHQVVATNAGSEGFVTHSPGSDGVAYVEMPADQAHYWRVRTQIGAGATHAALMIRRLQGKALKN